MSYFPTSANAPTIQNVSAAGTTAALNWNSIVLVNATAGNVVITLPAPTNKAGQDVKIVKTDATANTVSVQSTSGTLNGVAAGTSAVTLANVGMAVDVGTDGTNAYSVSSEWNNLGVSVQSKVAAAGAPLSYTLTATDEVVLADATLNIVNLTLPQVSKVSSLNDNKRFVVKVLGIGAGFAVNVTPNAADTLEVSQSSPPTFGAAGVGQALSPAGSTMSMRSDFANNRWVIE